MNRNTLREYSLKHERNNMYSSKLKSFLDTQETLVKQINTEKDEKSLSKLNKKYTHLSGYIRYLKKKVERTC